MGRTQRALTSLVAAIPAGFLAYLLVMVFLNRADSLTTMTQVVVGVTLLCAAVVALMPIGLMIFTGKKAASDDEEVVARPSRKVQDDEDEVEAAEEVEELDEVASESDELSAFEESDGDIMADSDDEITGPASSLDEIESVDFDDDEEEVKPKKRKK